MSDLPSTTQVLCFESFQLDIRAGELRKEGTKLRLQGQPLLVLAMLLKHAGQLVTREELRAEVWPADTFVDFDHSLHNAIARIRETLGDSAESPRFIETLPRRGYRFVERVVEGQAGGAKSAGHSEASTRNIQSLAVLPLDDHSADQKHEYFADGMTEALITALAKIKALRVISRTSAMQYRGIRKSLPEIARELNVDAVIEGSVLRSGERVRISAQLIHAGTDQHLWAESYERDFRDILSVQSEIARQVATQVRIMLTPEERTRLGDARQVDPEAQELYFKARYFWNKRTEGDVAKALSFFRQAIECDPAYAQSYAGLADCYNILGYYNALPPAEAYPKAKAAALKALELDSGVAEAHATLGVVKRDFEWDWTGAETEFDRAIELNPGCVDAHHWRGTLLCMLGRFEEGMGGKKKALAMDPLSIVIKTDVARMHYYLREHDEAIKQFQAVLDMDQDFGPAHLGLAKAYEQEGMFQPAIEELKTGARLSKNSNYALTRLAQGYAKAGQFEEARMLLKQLNAPGQTYVSAYDIAMIRLSLREIDDAFAWLQKALEQRSLWLGYLNIEPELDSLRSDPKFKALQRQVGLSG